MDYIYINDYLSFNKAFGCFQLSATAQEILYRKKHIICSYSGCNDWAHHFFCELIDLYSGSSKYNYALGTVVHVQQIKNMYSEGHSNEVINWIERHKSNDWFIKAATMLTNIIDDVPTI